MTITVSELMDRLSKLPGEMKVFVNVPCEAKEHDDPLEFWVAASPHEITFIDSFELPDGTIAYAIRILSESASDTVLTETHRVHNGCAEDQGPFSSYTV